MNTSKNGNIDRKDFWDGKILVWEEERYNKDRKGFSWLERIASNASQSLRYRLALTENILLSNCHGKTIAEVGCGTSRLASKLIEAGAEHYHGFDISSVAIERATACAAQAEISDKVSYTVANIDSLPNLHTDIVFSMGLLDWLSDTEIEMLLHKSAQSDCLHSFSESRFQLSQYLHRAYVYIAYGHRTGSYIPRYLKANWLKGIVEQHSRKPVHFIRDQKLSFGAFVSTLPQNHGSLQ
jgi:SAM-dependent methyltransferase